MQLISDDLLEQYNRAWNQEIKDLTPNWDEDRGNVISWFKPVSFKNIVDYLTENMQLSPWNIEKRFVNTYWFVTDYFEGGFMKPHHDRPSCDYSVTINMAQDGPDWPLYVWDNDHFKSNISKPGEAVWYRGLDTWHFRQRTEGKRYRQLMIHWVEEGSWQHEMEDTQANIYSPSKRFVNKG